MANAAQNINSRTVQLLSKKFGLGIEIAPLPPDFTPGNLAKWAGFNLKPVFLPNEEIGEQSRLKNWVKPERWFYDQIREGKISSDSAQLQGGWYLADFTVGTDHTDGTQVFKDDPLSPIIAQLREDGKVGQRDNTPKGSRFAITHDEWQAQVLPAIASQLGFNPNHVRLERAVEFSSTPSATSTTPTEASSACGSGSMTSSRFPPGFTAATASAAVWPTSAVSGPAQIVLVI